MRGAALSDIHLGYRYGTKVVAGRNVREVDVEAAWHAAVASVVATQPHLVTIAGDIFHHPRVSDFSKRAFLQGIQDILDKTQAVVVALIGNHDAGRTADVLSPVHLADIFGGEGRFWLVTRPERLRLQVMGQTVSVACFPFTTRTAEKAYKLEPDADADVNILLMHAAVKGSPDGDKLPFFYGSDQALDVGREADRWDVVHVGDFHTFRRLHPERLAFYSGALERTTSNIWDEYEKRGVVLYDTLTNNLVLLSIWNREMRDYDLGDFDHPPGVGAEEVNQCLAKMEEWGTLGHMLVRFKLDSFPREEREHIDWSIVRRLKQICTYFNLDIRYKARDLGELGERRSGTAVSLGEEANTFFADDPEEVRAKAISYLDLDAEAEEEEEVHDA